MADTVRRVDYFYTMTPHKPGEGARVLGLLRSRGVNLLAFSAFPAARRAQLDFVPVDSANFVAVTKELKIKLSPRKTVFLLEGDDRVGAIAEITGKLGAAKINITAVDAVCTGGGMSGMSGGGRRFAALLWVKPRDVQKAAAVLGATG